jgi:hypothetical protein
MILTPLDNRIPREDNMPFSHQFDPDLLGYGHALDNPVEQDFFIPADKELSF